MAIAAASLPRPLEGVTQPRIAPPVPAVSMIEQFTATAAEMDIQLMPWQTLAARYLVATNGDRWKYQDVAIVVARQNGKTMLLQPLIVQRLRMGRKIIHTAQNRTLPRKVFMDVARALKTSEMVSVRFANGQEEIVMRNGGTYTIIAPQRGARGMSADDLIFDEVREFEEYDIIAAAKPTLGASLKRNPQGPQVIYLSNAGSDRSVVLNDLRRKSDEADEGGLAYLEWSAAPERSISDREGWAEANPGLGETVQLETLESFYTSMPAAEFETEHLCRWVASMQPKLVSEADWMKCRGDVSTPERPYAAFSMSPDGTRASAAMAWRMADGRVALVELLQAEGSPIDVDRLGPDLKKLLVKNRVRKTTYASWTDASLARYLPKAETLDGKEFADACGTFVRLVQSGRLVWDGAEHITEDLMWTSRKPHESGAWTAVHASPERPVTAALAAIRAVKNAADPKPPLPRIG